MRKSEASGKSSRRAAGAKAGEVSQITPETAAFEGPACPFPVVAIGASAGGLEALTQLVEHLGPDSGMAYVIVQHFDPTHKSMLTELLSRHTSLPVEEVRKRTVVEQNHIYVIPPNRNLSLESGSLALSPRTAFAGLAMPIDYLFRTVALECPGNCIGIVLSGTGSDGSLGVGEIKSVGGITFAQDSASARHDGMPRSAVATGSVDYVLPPAAIALELKRIGAHPYAHGKLIAELNREAVLQRVFTILRKRTAVDFRNYKQSTVKRRIFRRMALLQIETVDDYVRVLMKDQEEVDALYQDMLIKVTCFFREPNSFKFLQEHVFPSIVRHRARRDPIRLWVPGCSTGEEVYSLAIALLEHLGDRAGGIPIQIFGTDVSLSALEKARTGIFIENIAIDVSPERLRRWFVRSERGYQISKDIREMCVFARQNVVADPPFSKIDLISCRNLLIYLDTPLQARVMPIFHYALRDNGYLMLGESESVGARLDLFNLVDKKRKIYAKKPGSPVSGIFFRSPLPQPSDEEKVVMPAPPRTPDVHQEADRFIVARFAPAGVIVDDDGKIIQFRGATGDYLEPAPGAAAFQLLKMARGNLGPELRALLQRARTTERPVRKDKIRFQLRRGAAREINLEVAPIRAGAAGAFHFLVLFEEPPVATAAAAEPPAATAEEKPEEAGLELADVRRELMETRALLQSTIEESEAINEELKSANEEVMSSNEELQSTNEELETAKEELQSSNEELTTVNEEVQTRNAELHTLNNDLTNFVGSVNIPVIMLGADLRIRRFTSTSQRVFHLIPSDIGRPFGDIKPKVRLPNLDRLITEVIDTVTVQEREVVDEEGRYYQLSIRPYRTPENQIDGAVLVFSDIDSIKRASLQLDEARAYAEAIVEAVCDPLVVLDADFVIQRANSAYYRLFETDARQTETRSLFALDKSQWDLPGIRQLLREAFQRRKTPRPVEITETFSRIGERSLLVNARPMVRKSGERHLILLSISDITAGRRVEREKAAIAAELGRERALFEAILRQMSLGVAIFEAPGGKLLLANQGLRNILGPKIPLSAHAASFRHVLLPPMTGQGKTHPSWPIDRSLRHGETVVGEEIVLQRARAERSVIRLSSSPVYDGDGVLIAVVALFHDTTATARAEEQIVKISSREQRRIAHDLHDGLGQELAAIVYRLKALKTHTRNDEADEAGKIGQLAAAALVRLRDLVKFLQPVAMDEQGLMQSLRDLARSSSSLYRIDCAFLCPRPVAIVNQDVALHVFRIAQEAVHNAVKHGKPSRITIELRRRSRRAELIVRDNGSGFKPPRGSRQSGLGLHIMRYRAHMLNGTVVIKDRRPRGTEVRCLFDLTAKP
jgi:two-component system CheB/CheR fusion protein